MWIPVKKRDTVPNYPFSYDRDPSVRPERVILRNVVDSIQAINGQNADKIIGLRVLNSLKTHKQS